MRALVLAEHDNSLLKPATLSAVTAALALGGSATVLVAGSGCAKAAEAAGRIAGIDKVLVADHPGLKDALAEPLAALLSSLAPDFDALLAPATSTGKSVMPRLAAMLDVQPVSDIVAVAGPDTFVRPIYAGNALATVKSRDAKRVLTVRATAFAPAGEGEGAAVEALDFAPPPCPVTFVSRTGHAADRPELTSAKVVVAGGRGIGSEAAFAMVGKLADLLGGAVGATRAAVDAGYIPNDSQIGQTGKIVAPDLYFAMGISGAIQHLAGMKDSRIIVAINKDPEAPIFQIADYGLVADVFEAMPKLIDALKT